GVAGNGCSCAVGASGGASALRGRGRRRWRSGVDGQGRSDAGDRRRAIRDVRDRFRAVSVRVAGVVVARARSAGACVGGRRRARRRGRRVGRTGGAGASAWWSGRRAHRRRGHGADAVHRDRRLWSVRGPACAWHRCASHPRVGCALHIAAVGDGSRRDPAADHWRRSRSRQRATPGGSDCPARPVLDSSRRRAVGCGRPAHGV
ncbi:MAG: hypothetical protein AVDCRST_MAG67-1577, partial [uncultured Solirubrobacteraceae bacterium]